MALPPEVLVTTMRTNQKYLALSAATARWHPGSCSSPTSSARRRGRRSSPATSACCAPACGTPSSSGTRTARRRWRAACRASTRWSSTPSSARRASGWSGWWRWRALSCRSAPEADRPLAERAALLAKADLSTGMVGEFPELQGIMGGHYARAQGEAEAVARPFASTTRRRVRTTAARPRRRAWSWRWPTSSTRWSASSLQASGRPAPRTRSRCAAPASASSGWCSRTGLRLPLREAIPGGCGRRLRRPLRRDVRASATRS